MNPPINGDKIGVVIRDPSGEIAKHLKESLARGERVIMRHSLAPQRRLVRRWGKLWRLMRSRRDRLGMAFAVERAKIWREYVNRGEKNV